MYARLRSFGWFLVVFIFLIFALNTGNMYYGWQRHFPWFDAPMHFLGGAWIGFASLWFLVSRGCKVAGARKFIYAIAAVTVVGFYWEVYEFLMHFLKTGIWTFDSVDTAGDFVFNYLGAIIAAHFTKYFLE